MAGSRSPERAEGSVIANQVDHALLEIKRFACDRPLEGEIRHHFDGGAGTLKAKRVSKSSRFASSL